jgi:hypothetical protein
MKTTESSRYNDELLSLMLAGLNRLISAVHYPFLTAARRQVGRMRRYEPFKWGIFEAATSDNGIADVRRFL